jgi:hypothetical protein
MKKVNNFPWIIKTCEVIDKLLLILLSLSPIFFSFSFQLSFWQMFLFWLVLELNQIMSVYFTFESDTHYEIVGCGSNQKRPPSSHRASSCLAGSDFEINYRENVTMFVCFVFRDGDSKDAPDSIWSQIREQIVFVSFVEVKFILFLPFFPSALSQMWCTVLEIDRWIDNRESKRNSKLVSGGGDSLFVASQLFYLTSDSIPREHKKCSSYFHILNNEKKGNVTGFKGWIGSRFLDHWSKPPFFASPCFGCTYNNKTCDEK